MKIRSYLPDSDFDEIKTWLSDARSHALWCANLMPYPLEKTTFENTLKKLATKSEDKPFAVITEEGKLIGFFCYSINSGTKEGKLKFVILSPAFRGKGYGKKMVLSALKYAFENTKVASVELNVFDNNVQAKNCYLKVGFKVRSSTENAFRFNNENWTRCNMVINDIKR